MTTEGDPLTAEEDPLTTILIKHLGKDLDGVVEDPDKLEGLRGLSAAFTGYIYFDFLTFLNEIRAVVTMEEFGSPEHRLGDLEEKMQELVLKLWGNANEAMDESGKFRKKMEENYRKLLFGEAWNRFGK